MGKSYIIKYVVEVDRDSEKRTTAFEMTLGECVMRYAIYNNGAKKGDKIKVWEQVGNGNYIVEVKKDIKVSEKDRQGILDTNNIEVQNSGIQWRNRWLVPRSYFKKYDTTFEAVSY